MLRTLAIAAAFGLSSMCALAADRMPTDNELRTAYCIPVMQAEVQSQQTLASAMPEGEWRDSMNSAVAQTSDKLNRLRSYLIPKVPQLDTQSLIIAAERGKADNSTSLQAQLGCYNQCEASKPPKGFDKRYGDCLSSCQAANPAIGRTRACMTVDWLPF